MNGGIVTDEANEDRPLSVMTDGSPVAPRRRLTREGLLLATLMFGVGLAAGYRWRSARSPAGLASVMNAVLFKPHRLSVAYGSVGPKLLAAGAIDADRLAASLTAGGTPVTGAQWNILREGSTDSIRIDRADAPFLLDFFWAVGLVNRNPVLTIGPMARGGEKEIGRFASTGGWTLGAKPAMALYASQPLVPLTPEQQRRTEEVAWGVYRPCCDNPAYYPDCNHGMAMLGLLSVLAAGGASEAQMFEAAAVANAVWYPEQYAELAAYFKAKGTPVDKVDPRELVGRDVASTSGFRTVHAYLTSHGLLVPGASGGAGAC